MNATSTVRIALRAMWSNKMRALLTTLGVLIGVGALIAITAIGAGAKANVEHVFASMGTNLVIILPGSTSMGGVNGGFGSMPTLTWDDVAAIQRDVASVEAMAPELRANVAVIAGDQNWTTSLTGTSPEFFEMRCWPMTRGELLLASVALVSLVVGGIGITNIMLVSVTERTREIGIRIALGAQPRHILLQFVVEALALSVAGGLLGIVCGVATAASVAERLHWPIRVQPAVVAVSLVFSALVGVVFGLYPARKASAVDPIDALRFE